VPRLEERRHLAAVRENPHAVTANPAKAMGKSCNTIRPMVGQIPVEFQFPEVPLDQLANISRPRERNQRDKNQVKKAPRS
jgi:hypothetical protein